jgi:hypothetical protein
MYIIERRRAMRAIKYLSLLCALVCSTTVFAGNDLLYADWPVSSSTVYSAGYYYLYVAQGGANTNDPLNNAFTTGWIGVNLDHQCTDFGICPGGDQFTQTGVFSQSGGIAWFVYSESGVFCNIGFEIYGSLGCEGDDNSFVRSREYNAYNIYHDYTTHHWQAAMLAYDGTNLDLATIVSDSPRIYRAQATAEEAYGSSTDPFDSLAEYFYHPHYVTSEWPPYGMFQIARLPAQDPPCVYGGQFFVNGDSRWWYAGGGATDCTYSIP